MSDRAFFILAHATARQRAKAAIDIAPDGYVVEVKQRYRNSDQNALLHALLGEIAERKEWAGRKWDSEEWKRLLTAAWMRSRHEAPIMVPAIGAQTFEVLYRRTSTLTRGECADLITFIQAWAVEEGITLHEDAHA